jgi:FkbM family methyltransferase
MNKNEIKDLLGKDDPVILEIGCNDGEDSFEFLNTFKDIRLHCFEPDYRALEDFLARCSTNENRVGVYPIAISNIDGEIDFHLSGGINPIERKLHHKSSSIKKPTGHLQVHRWCKFDEVVKVKTKKLDTWVVENEIENIDFIWADVQGAEKELIEGGISTLTNKTKYFYTEVENMQLYEGQINLQQIKAMLPTFEVVRRIENNVLMRNGNV